MVAITRSFVAATFLGLTFFFDNAAIAETVKIGIVQATTGGSPALYGTSQKNGIELAVGDAIAAKTLGDLQVELIHLDDGGERGQTVNAFQRLINRDNVSVILGPTQSTSAFAADPIAQKAGVPVLSSSNTAPGITAIGDYIFRISPPEDRIAPGVLKHIIERYGVKRAAQLYGVDDQLTKSAYTVQKKALEDAKVDIVATETFQKGDVEFAAQLTKIKAAKPDIIVLGAFAEESASIIRQARQLGIDAEIKFIGQQASISTKFFELAGAAGEGFIAGTAWFAGSTNKESQAFVEKYAQKYGHQPDIFAAYGYQSATLLLESLKAAKSGDRKAIREALLNIKGFPGVLGTVEFGGDRELTITPKILVAQNGRFVLLP